MTTDIYQPDSTPSANDAENVSLIHQRIQNLTPRLIAYSTFIESPELERADVQQEMYKALLEKAAKDPAFAAQKDAYLVRYATWMAKHAAERTWTYGSHVERQQISLAEDDDIFDTFSDDTEDPARIVERNENLDEIIRHLQELSPENQTVIRMIYLGYSESEIATELNISRPAVTQRKRTIAHQIGVEA